MRRLCAAGATLPLLRKDFIDRRLPDLEARAAGADAILLIVAALEPTRAGRPAERRPRRWAWTALVEVHDEDEMARGARASAHA